MNSIEFLIILILWLVAGVVYLKRYGEGTFASIMIIKLSGYRFYSLLMTVLCLLLWPLSLFVSLLMMWAFAKYKKIPIPKDR